MKYGKIYTLDDLQALSSEGAFRPAGAVADSLGALVDGTTDEVEVPSLMDLAVFYGCTNLTVYDAMRILKSRGYDYRLRGIDHPIQICRV